jgi:bifunctional DNA-binding transcriptional regulator/antitoxin component of YhaV-PrlF toxin-antitoxin module
MGIIVNPKITVPKIEIPVDANDESGAQNIMNVLGPVVPVIKINDYVLSLGDLNDYSINVHINTVPTFNLEIIDTKLKIRKALGIQEIDTVVIFVGNDKFYHKYNGIITNVISDAGDEIITITGIVYNPKLYNDIQKSYNNNSVTDILTDICTMTDMGLFTYENSRLTNIIEECLNPGKRYIDFFIDIIERLTDNLWCFDNYYFLHVGDINTIRNKPVDTYTVRNNKLFDSPKPIIITSNPLVDAGVDYVAGEVETKLHCQYFTINTNIGNGHIESYDDYNLHYFVY